MSAIEHLAKTDTTSVSVCGSSYGSKAYIVKWTLLMVLALALVFMARLFGFAENPFGFHYPPFALVAGIASVLVLMGGVYTLTRPAAKSQPMMRRRGVMLVVLAAIMLVSFFAFKQIIPLVF